LVPVKELPVLCSVQEEADIHHLKHRPFILYLHILELIEVSALKEAVKNKVIEKREPFILAYDVLVQFLVTLALGGGFMLMNYFRH
jgi:Lhr-like helicase